MHFNHAEEALLSRRTVRAFRPEQISNEELTDILNAARYAPSSLGQQNRFFTVIQNPQLHADIVSATTAEGGTFTPGHEPFYGAPTVIIFSAPEASRYGREDAACAAMCLMLSAHSYGLGSCYICSVVPGLRTPGILTRLGLPQGYLPCGAVAIGYPAEDAPAPKERRTDDTLILS